MKYSNIIKAIQWSKLSKKKTKNLYQSQFEIEGTGKIKQFWKFYCFILKGDHTRPALLDSQLRGCVAAA
jgi:hypothetical protein